MSSSRSRRQVRRLHLVTPYVRQPSVHNALRADRKLIRAAWKRRPAPWITVDVRPHLEAFAQMMLAFSSVTDTFAQSAAVFADMGEQLARERDERAAAARTAVATAFPQIRGQQCTLSIIDETHVLMQSAVAPERLAPAEELIARINESSQLRARFPLGQYAPQTITLGPATSKPRTHEEMAELRRQYFEGGQPLEESQFGAEYIAHVRAARDRVQAAQRTHLQKMLLGWDGGNDLVTVHPVEEDL
ncbi:hypothetical protein [Cryobacterium cryoconiti]|uniref:Uncharacterized protein n=1 Tax=Cryobacterium cryoconiti TaxID=1259239 RepID=A0A4Y8JS59_9MICO|nr:hypothetical protein [Cryobacterium cryoconiti]TFD27504.1 hypothetical protein E3T49_13260 [Cryobacterium cryoconiti]